ncbi:MAG: DUF2971 domain-containing protein [Lachnospiraceae bacterium]|nr:DUF2971 domain-containing protein [Lachnospiraceae bacterium]
MNIVKINNLTNVDENTRIARYFKFDHFKQLVQNKNLYLSNANKFTDKNERRLPPQFFMYKNKKTEEIHNKMENGKNEIVHAYISCWTEFIEESYAFWKIYVPDNNGVCAVTTVKKLRDSMMDDKNLIICKVDYIKTSENRTNCTIPTVDFDEFPYSHTLKEVYKIYPYEYEKEIRLVKFLKSNKTNVNLDLVDELNIFDEIYINPFANEETVDKLQNFCNEYYRNARILTSSINDK